MKEEYTILPFQFTRFAKDKVLLTNIAGEFIFLNAENFESFIDGSLNNKEKCFLDLQGKNFLTDGNLITPIELLSTKLRTRKEFLVNFTSLHMIVMTLRCNCACRYCHASSEDDINSGWDIDSETARKTVEMIFKTPSDAIKIEFQGGEPLLNWDIVKEIVIYANKLNLIAKKRLEFVICTNLTLIKEEHLLFCKKHSVQISTSLDGPRDLHDSNRILRKGGSSYDLFLTNLKKTRLALGEDSVSALLTVSSNNIHQLDKVVDEYLRLGFNGIFLRSLNPFGYAYQERKSIGYGIDEFVNVYKETLSRIVEINLAGRYFVEFFTTVLLSRILTPFSTGFVDLQSPAGTGISGVIYNYNGDVYPSDEARMLAKMGKNDFVLGNVKTDEYLKVFNGKKLRGIINKTVLEGIPGCSWCAFQQYCGADPIRNFAETGDVVGKRPNDFCEKNKQIMLHLFELIEKDNETMDVFWSWLTKRSLNEVQNV